MWYFKPLACLYDLLQFGLGHLKGLERRREVAGRDNVVLARAACAEEEVGEEVPFKAEPVETWLLGPAVGDATRDGPGVLEGVLPALLLSRSAGGTQLLLREPYEPFA